LGTRELVLSNPLISVLSVSKRGIDVISFAKHQVFLKLRYLSSGVPGVLTVAGGDGRLLDGPINVELSHVAVAATNRSCTHYELRDRIEDLFLRLHVAGTGFRRFAMRYLA
jgi:hypothetical protein